MTIDPRAVAIRFADLWAVDPHQMVDEIYSTDIVMENMANPARVILGSVQLHAVEDDLAARIPEHRHELVRVIVGDGVACLETTVVAPVTHEYAPACVWWWFDREGKVAAEVGWFDWSDRSNDSKRSHGTVPPSLGAGDRRDASWCAWVAGEYTRCWTSDPIGSALSMYAPDCTFGRVGRDELRGVRALAGARQAELDDLPPPERWMRVHRVIGEGSVVAMLIAMGDARRVTRGTVVLTFDSTDRIVSERTYCDWNKAVPRDELGARQSVGAPDWTLAS